eukprot:1181889-Prorocentrum_minimum.AAC.1
MPGWGRLSPVTLLTSARVAAIGTGGPLKRSDRDITLSSTRLKGPPASAVARTCPASTTSAIRARASCGERADPSSERASPAMAATSPHSAAQCRSAVAAASAVVYWGAPAPSQERASGE